MSTSQLIGVGLNADARIVAQREQIVDHLESVLATGHIHAGNVNQVGKLRLMMILKELQHGHHALWRNKHLQLIAGGQLHLLHVLGQALGHIAPEIGEMRASDCVRLADSGCGWNVLHVIDTAIKSTVTYAYPPS